MYGLIGERILVSIHKTSWQDMKYKQHWKCGNAKCNSEYYATVKASAVTCKNGHKMKLVAEKDEIGEKDG